MSDDFFAIYANTVPYDDDGYFYISMKDTALSTTGKHVSKGMS